MLQHRSSRVLFFLFIILLIASCSSPVPTNSPVLPTETLSPSATAAATGEAGPLETATTAPTQTPALDRPQYVIDMQLNYGSKAANVDQVISYPNWTGETLTNIVLAVEPNLWSGGFSLKSVSVDGQPVTNFSIENMTQRLEIPLPQPLEPGTTANVHLKYGLILPPMQAYINASNDVRPHAWFGA